MVKIQWQKMDGLIPAIAQDFRTNEVLMLAFMDEQAFELSIKTGFAHYYSRSKERIWKKGEESGNVQIIKNLFLDCDNDTLLLKVEQIGIGACHTGRKSCFFTEINLSNSDIKTVQKHANSAPKYDIFDEVYNAILERKLNANPQNSYVANLFTKGDNAILKKVCEEAHEFCLACKDLERANKYAKFELESFGEHQSDNPKFDLVYEGADLVFHLFVALATHDIHPDQIKFELQRRFGVSGIDEKNSRSK